MNNTGMLDILFCMLFLFFIVTVLQATVMRIESSKKNVESTAEFLITMTWPDGYNDDIDLYVEDPVGNVIFYKVKSKGLMHLERDDLGSSNDKIFSGDTKAVILQNMEIATLRGFVAGEYTVNIHAFNLSPYKMNPNGDFVPKEGETVKVPVKIRIEKLNPYSIVSVDEIILEYGGQEETALRFTLDKDGQVVEKNKLPKKFVKDQK